MKGLVAMGVVGSLLLLSGCGSQPLQATQTANNTTVHNSTGSTNNTAVNDTQEATNNTARAATNAVSAVASQAPKSAPTLNDNYGLTTTQVQDLVMKSLGLDPSKSVETTSQSGQQIYAVEGMCIGSQDGHCWGVEFFSGTQLLTPKLPSGAIANTDTSESPRLDVQNQNTIDVTYAHLLPSDSLANPTGTPVVVSYTWQGYQLIASGNPPS